MLKNSRMFSASVHFLFIFMSLIFSFLFLSIFFVPYQEREKESPLVCVCVAAVLIIEMTISAPAPARTGEPLLVTCPKKPVGTLKIAESVAHSTAFGCEVGDIILPFDHIRARTPYRWRLRTEFRRLRWVCWCFETFFRVTVVVFGTGKIKSAS